MSSPISIDLFVEDRAHEEFLLAMLDRLAYEEQKGVILRARSGRGGHGRALSEFSLYQESVLKGFAGMAIPDILVIAIDANCKPFNTARNEIETKVNLKFKGKSLPVPILILNGGILQTRILLEKSLVSGRRPAGKNVLGIITRKFYLKH